jgi:hypothetical protein
MLLAGRRAAACLLSLRSREGAAAMVLLRKHAVFRDVFREPHSVLAHQL